MTEEPEVTVSEMLRRVATGRAELDSLLSELPEGVTANGWTRAEHMAHLAAWEHSALALLRGEPRHAHLGISGEQFEAMSMDDQNAHIVELFKARPLPEIRDYYERIHAELVDHIASMSDADLQRPYSYFQPDDPPYNANPVWPWIVGNTYEHYAEHIEIMRAPTA